jgi:hypothetical protein
MDSFRTLNYLGFHPLEVKPIATTLVAGLVIYWLCSAFYLAVLHPLAKFPGPKLAAVSDWWLVYQECLLGRSLTDILADLHQVHGKVVSRIAYNATSVPRPKESKTKTKNRTNC